MDGYISQWLRSDWKMSYELINVGNKSEKYTKT